MFSFLRFPTGVLHNNMQHEMYFNISNFFCGIVYLLKINPNQDRCRNISMYFTHTLPDSFYRARLSFTKQGFCISNVIGWITMLNWTEPTFQKFCISSPVIKVRASSSQHMQQGSKNSSQNRSEAWFLEQLFKVDQILTLLDHYS